VLFLVSIAKESSEGDSPMSTEMGRFEINKKSHRKVALQVFPKGFEPPSSEPESDILSIELREQCAANIEIYYLIEFGIMLLN
jgi:hypothetical protein